MDNNLKDFINIPDNLDEVVLKGYKRAKKEERKNIIFNKKSLAAAAVVVGIIGVGGIGLNKVNAYSVIENVFDYFIEGEYKQNLDKYKEFGKDVNLKVDEKGVTITLNKIVIDDNTLVTSLTVQSDKLRGYENTEKPKDFIDMDYDILINGENTQLSGMNVNIIDERTAAVILESDVSNLSLEDFVNIDLKVRRIRRGDKKIASGKWDFSIKVNKGSEINSYNLDKNLINNEKIRLDVDKLLVTPLENKLILKGKIYDYNPNDEVNIRDKSNDIYNFIVRDNEGNVILTESTSGNIKLDGEFNYGFKILNDLSQREYIDIIKIEENKVLRGEDNNYVLKCSSSEDNSNLDKEHISRKPTEKELRAGYALDEISYNVNLNKDTAFESIDELIGKEIVINKDNKVLVKDIKVNNNYTEVVFKVTGSYDYRLLGSAVMFDENMKDYCAFEGASTTIVDIENKLISVKIAEVDTTKKYTIGIPEVSNLILNEQSKVRIKLK